MNTYTNVFGGENINPADLSYKAYTLTENIQLDWPFEALDGSFVVADKIDIIADAGLTVTMPDASKVSVGEDVLWNNVGANAFTVLAYDGSTVITVEPGKQWYIYLIDNTTAAGVWRITQLGAGTSVADAASLAGFGLRANLTKLDQHLQTDLARSDGDQTLTESDRAQVFRNLGGGCVYNLTSAALLGNGWFAIAINAGSGNVVLTPPGAEEIDHEGTKTLSPGESCVIYSFGTGFSTMGYGRALASTVAGIVIDVAGAGDQTLTTVQVAAQVQDYAGILTGDRTLIYGTGVTGYWFVYNRTTGGFTLSVKGSAVDDPAIIIPVNSFTILRSQAGALDIAFTATSGTVTSISTVLGEITGGVPPAPIISSGTIGLADMPAGVSALTPGTYGTAAGVPQITIDPKGRTSHAVTLPIAITGSQITDLSALLSVLFPPGMIIAWGAWTTIPIPGGEAVWLPCDGTTRLIADFPNLAGVISNVYAPATGTHFVLPDTRGCVLMGQDPGVRVSPEWFPGGHPNVVGNLGGVQVEAANINIPKLFVRVGYWNTPVQNSTASASVTLSGDTGGASIEQSGLQFGGGGVFTGSHTHSLSGTFGMAWTASGFGAYGQTDQALNTAAPGYNGTTSVTNMQPSLVIRHLIKT